MCALDPVPVQWVTDRAVETQPLGQGKRKQLRKEELVSSPYLMGNKGSGQRLCFGKVLEVIKLFSQIPG